jgi:hypothetical protein
MNLTDSRTSSAYKFTLLKSVNITNPRLRQPAVIAERKKFHLNPCRSPRDHCQTAVFDQVRQAEGFLWPGQPWDHTHLCAKYKRAPSEYLVRETTFSASAITITRTSGFGGTSARHLPSDENSSTIDDGHSGARPTNEDSSAWEMPPDKDSRVSGSMGDDSSTGVNLSKE